MPKCKDCPIVIECQKTPLWTSQPSKWKNTKKGKVPIKYIPVRVCPLLVMLSGITRQFGSPQVKKP